MDLGFSTRKQSLTNAEQCVRFNTRRTFGSIMPSIVRRTGVELPVVMPLDIRGKLAENKCILRLIRAWIMD